MVDVFFGRDDRIWVDKNIVKIPDASITCGEFKEIIRKSLKGSERSHAIFIIGPSLDTPNEILLKDLDIKKIFIYFPSNDANSLLPKYSQVSKGFLNIILKDHNITVIPDVKKGYFVCETCTSENKNCYDNCYLCEDVAPDYVFKIQRDLENFNHKDSEKIVQTQEDYYNYLDECATSFKESVSQSQSDVFLNHESFECEICFDLIAIGEGIIIRACTHYFCKDCLRNAINAIESVSLKCPNAECRENILEFEIRYLLKDNPNSLKRYEYIVQSNTYSLLKAQGLDIFSCPTPNCKWTVIIDNRDQLGSVCCQLCQKEFCFKCDVPHSQVECNQIVRNRENNNLNLQYIDNRISDGTVMKCPGCKIPIDKDGGCNFVECKVCKMQICWATKGPRWGPKGRGDNSGGCRCGLAGPCVPNCRGCSN